MKIKKAILPVAGLGTRFLPLSKVLPKELFPLGEKPLIQWIVEEALEAGVEEFIFVISKGKENIIKYFKEDKKLISFLKDRKKEKELNALLSLPKIKINFAYQNFPRGDGDAILKAEKFIKDEPFFVFFGDDISFNKNGPQMAWQLLQGFERVKKPILCLYKKPKKELSSYGVAKIEKGKKDIVRVFDIVEKPKENPPSNFALVGKYILTPEIFFYLKRTQPFKGEIVLANALKEMISGKKEIFGVKVKGKWIECGSKEKWIQSFLEIGALDTI